MSSNWQVCQQVEMRGHQHRNQTIIQYGIAMLRGQVLVETDHKAVATYTCAHATCRDNCARVKRPLFALTSNVHGDAGSDGRCTGNTAYAAETDGFV